MLFVDYTYNNRLKLLIDLIDVSFHSHQERMQCHWINVGYVQHVTGCDEVDSAKLNLQYIATGTAKVIGDLLWVKRRIGMLTDGLYLVLMNYVTFVTLWLNLDLSRTHGTNPTATLPLSNASAVDDVTHRQAPVSGLLLKMLALEKPRQRAERHKPKTYGVCAMLVLSAWIGMITDCPV